MMENANILCQAIHHNEEKLAPLWYKRSLFTILCVFHGLFEVICVCYSLATGTLLGLYIYYHFLCVISMIATLVSSINLWIFARYLRINRLANMSNKSIKRLNRARYRTYLVLFLLLIGFFGAFYFCVIMSNQQQHANTKSNNSNHLIINDKFILFQRFKKLLH